MRKKSIHRDNAEATIALIKTTDKGRGQAKRAQHTQLVPDYKIPLISILAIQAIMHSCNLSILKRQCSPVIPNT